MHSTKGKRKGVCIVPSLDPEYLEIKLNVWSCKVSYSPFMDDV